jgi:hypothetical protein
MDVGIVLLQFRRLGNLPMDSIPSWMNSFALLLSGLSLFLATIKASSFRKYLESEKLRNAWMPGHTGAAQATGGQHDVVEGK